MNKKRKRKELKQDNLSKIVLATALVNLIKALIELINKLIE